MSDGSAYNLEFNKACSELVYRTDEEAIRATLCGVEYALSEAIRGAFFVAALLQAVLLMIPISWALGVSDMDWPVRALFFGLFIGYGAVSYWISRFVFWLEVSRHVKPRRFGE